MVHGVVGSAQLFWEEPLQAASSAQSLQHLRSTLQTKLVTEGVEVSSARGSQPSESLADGAPVMSDTEAGAEVGKASAFDGTTVLVAAITAVVLTTLLLLVCYVIYRMRQGATHGVPVLHHTTPQARPWKTAAEEHSYRFTYEYSNQSSLHSTRSIRDSLPSLNSERGAFHPILNPAGERPGSQGFPGRSTSFMHPTGYRYASSRSAPVLADRRSSTWSGQPSNLAVMQEAAQKLANTFTASACTPQTVTSVGAPDHVQHLHPLVPTVQWQPMSPGSAGNRASTVSGCTASLGRTSWTPHACASPRAAGSALAAGPALPVWTTWNEMKFSEAGVQLQRPVQKHDQDTASSSQKHSSNSRKPGHTAPHQMLSASSRDESPSSTSSLAFVTISECVSYEKPWEHMPPLNGSAPNVADKNSQSWPCVSAPRRLSFADVRKRAKIHQDAQGQHSDDEEQQPPTPQMIMKQMRDSLRNNRSSKSNSSTKRRASSSSSEQSTNGRKPKKTSLKDKHNRVSSGVDDATTESEATTQSALDSSNSQFGRVFSKGNTQSIALSGSTHEGSGSTALTLRTHLTKESKMADSDGVGDEIRTTSIDLAASKQGQRYSQRRRRRKKKSREINACPEAWRALNEASYSSAASRGNQPSPNILKAITSTPNPVGSTIDATDATDSTYASDEGPSHRATIAAAATAALATEAAREKTKAYSASSFRRVAVPASGAASAGGASAALAANSYDSESDASKPVPTENVDTCERALQLLHCKALQTVEHTDIICSTDTDTSHAYSAGRTRARPAKRCSTKICTCTTGSTECVCTDARGSMSTDGGLPVAATTSMKLRALATAAAPAGAQSSHPPRPLQDSRRDTVSSATAEAPVSDEHPKPKQKHAPARLSSGSAQQSLALVEHDQSDIPLQMESAHRSSSFWMSSVRSSRVGAINAEKHGTQKSLVGSVSHALDPSSMSAGNQEATVPATNSIMELSGAESHATQSHTFSQAVAPNEGSHSTSPASVSENSKNPVKSEAGDSGKQCSNAAPENQTLSPPAARHWAANLLRYGSAGSDSSSAIHGTESSLEPSDSMLQRSLRASKALWADLSSGCPGSESSSQGAPKTTLASYLAGMRSESTGTVGSSDADISRSLGSRPFATHNSSTRSSSHASQSVTLPAAPVDSLPMLFGLTLAAQRGSSSGTSTGSAEPPPPAPHSRNDSCPAPRPRFHGLLLQACIVESSDENQEHPQVPVSRQNKPTDALVSLGADKVRESQGFASSGDRPSSGSTPSSVDSAAAHQSRQYNDDILPDSLHGCCDAAAAKQGSGGGKAATICVAESTPKEHATPPATAHTVTGAAAYDAAAAPVDSIACWIKNGQSDAKQAVSDNGIHGQEPGNGGRASGESDRADQVSVEIVARQLDEFSQMQLLMGKWEMLVASERYMGGQSVVQFAACMDTSRRFAIKFFCDQNTFYAEAAFYAAFSPELRTSPDIDAAARQVRIMHEEHALLGASVNFILKVEAVLDGSQGELLDSRGSSLPPCIVMERGEGLLEWAERTEPDLFSVLAVLSTIASVLADMHACGYVHSNIKPSNILWLPRQAMWAPVDFAHASHVGAEAPVAIHTLGYAAPEVAQAFQRGDQCMKASTAADAWALGIVAFELLYGYPSLKVAALGYNKVMEQLTGAALLPWETKIGVMKYTKVFEKPVMQLLHRDPAQRLSVRAFQSSCSLILGSLLEDV